MSELWENKSLKDICENLDGKRVPITKSKRKSGDVPYYGASGIVDHVDGYLFDENLLLVSEDGANLLARTYPIAFSISGKTWVNNHAHVLRFEKEETRRFVEYYLNSITLEPFVSGMAQPKLNQKSLNSIQIPFPEPSEQKRIVAILDEAFAGIDTAIANTEKNLANARELFESYLSSVFTKRGEGWVEKSINDVAELIDSLHKTPKYIEKGGYPMVRVTDVKGGKLNLKGAKRVDEATFIEFSKRHTSNIGDLVLSRVGTYGVPALVTSSEPFCLGQNTVFIVPNINSKMLYYFLLSPVSKEQVDKLVAGSTQPTISLKSIKSIKIPIPPEQQQEKIVENIDSFSADIYRLEIIYQEKIDALKELKQSLLQKAFSGELTAEADKLMDEAVA